MAKKKKPAHKPLRVGRPTEWTDERIQKEADDIIDWSEQDDALVLEKFALYRSPPYTRAILYKLAEKSKIFSNALLIAKERVRSRREEGAVTGTFNASVMQFTHAFYDRERNGKDQSFTAHKKEMKAADHSADAKIQAQALLDTRTFVAEAEAELAKRKLADSQRASDDIPS